MKKATKRVLAIGTGVAVLGVGGFLLYRHQHPALAAAPTNPSLPPAPPSASTSTGDVSVNGDDPLIDANA